MLYVGFQLLLHLTITTTGSGADRGNGGGGGSGTTTLPPVTSNTAATAQLPPIDASVVPVQTAALIGDGNFQVILYMPV